MKYFIQIDSLSRTFLFDATKKAIIILGWEKVVLPLINIRKKRVVSVIKIDDKIHLSFGGLQDLIE